MGLQARRSRLKKVESNESESDSDEEDTKKFEASLAPNPPGPPQGAPKPMAGMAAALKSRHRALKNVKAEDSESDVEVLKKFKHACASQSTSEMVAELEHGHEFPKRLYSSGSQTHFNSTDKALVPIANDRTAQKRGLVRNLPKDLTKSVRKIFEDNDDMVMIEASL